MATESLSVSAEENFRDTGVYAVSMWSIPGMSPSEIARAVGSTWLPHGQIRASTIGRLRAAGFEVRPSPANPNEPQGHVDVILDRPLSEEAATALRATFDQPERNPVALGRGGAGA
jgi:hypothetical protein